MANEKRLIDIAPYEGIKDAELCQVQVYFCGNNSSNVMNFNTRNIPTVDAVEVVRCRDCVYWTTEGNGYFEDEPHCGNPYGIEGYPKWDDYCSRGEHKSGTQPQREDIK